MFCWYNVNFRLVNFRGTLIFFLVFLLVRPSVAEPFGDERSIVFPSFFYKKMKGKFSKKRPVTMTFAKSGTKVYGNYFIGDTGAVHFFRGEMLSDGFTLKEINETDEEIATIKGRFQTKGSLKAEWRDSKSGKVIPFKMKEWTKDKVELSSQHYFSENCAVRNNYNPNLTGTGFTEDCSYIDIDLLRVTTPDGNVNERINTAIVEAVCQSGENKKGDIDGYMSSVMAMGEKEHLISKIRCEIVSINKNILSVCVVSRMQVGKSAPFNSKVYYNFDMRNGAKLSAQDVMVNYYTSKLNPLAEAKFNASYWTNGWGFEKYKFRLPANFALTASGILFEFNPYEMKLDVEAYPKVFFPYKQLIDVINPLSPLAMMLRAKKTPFRLSR